MIRELKPGRLKVSVIGAGRVGRALAAALARAGHTVVAVTTSRNVEAARSMLPGAQVTDVNQAVQMADLVLVTTPDDLIATVVENAAGLWRSGQIVAHACGRHGLEVLAAAAAEGAVTLALHPAMTFTGTSLDVDRLVDCPFAVTAPPVFEPVAQALVYEMGGQPTSLANELRPAYHGAICHGANHLVTLVTQAQRVLEELGFENPGAYITPLVRAALEGCLERGEGRITGPVQRGDHGTVAAHVAALEALPAALADIAPTYRQLADVTAKRAVAAGRIDDVAGERIRQALGPGELTPPHAEIPGVTGPQLAPANPGGQPSEQQGQRAGEQQGQRAGEQQGARPGGAVVTQNNEDFKRYRGRMRGTVGLVMTMGALHEGHLALVEAARAQCDHVIASVYVNPLQFGPHEDFEAYPRDLAADVALLEGAGVELIYAPTDEEIYPRRPLVRVEPGPVARILEGASRPQFFHGVLQVVCKVLNLSGAHYAYFGQKDAQQLALVKTMVADLNMPVEIVGVPIKRDATGLALSSRNQYLDDGEKAAALALSRALEAAEQMARASLDPARAIAAAKAVYAEAATGEVEVREDHFLAVDPQTFQNITSMHRGQRVLFVTAAWVGGTRLIDNREVQL